MQLPFPAFSPFVELIQLEKRSPQKIILRDHSSGVTATAGQLLHSVSFLREKLQATLLQNGIDNARTSGDDKFIFMIAPPGWEYVVSMLTIFSLGAGISPQSIVIRPEEMIRFLKLSNPLALLYAPAFAEKVEAIKVLCAEKDSGVNPRLPFMEIQTGYPDGLSTHTYETKPNTGLFSSQTGSLFFTSGTSGNQKGVIHSYQALLASARERIGTWKLTENDVVLNQKPGNWMGGIFAIIPSLISGACLETCAGVFNPKWFWDRISQGGVSVFDIAPTGYDRLAHYFDKHISVLPHTQKETYIHGMIATRVAGVSGSLLSPHTQKRWTELRRGKPLLNFYGSTEVLLICSMRWESPEYPDMCSVGPAVPGVEVKLVEGEMRLKAPSMFSRYLSDDPTLTEKAFDSEGFFKTGDCAEKLGDCYLLHGRANIDVFHFWGFTLHAGEIESALLSLPYISNAIVLPVEDEECQERAAAILQINPSFKSRQPDLETLRKDLTAKTGLMLFKLPTVVYWLHEGQEVSVTANGKVQKKDARKKFFGDGWRCKEGVEVLDLKGMEYWRMGGQC
ncbi:acetyl-CoA synthetase-like protein [Hyaloscypha hepaticicola]|uniref:Acetyl-CoA synthetase-like protein n=1 Tax=Hyaloscypha hepaticicola TaxID=2082293 RepID=A0A2J6Q4W2_9HELO|nr:acetyl-CoA synthetase-like protein [Hyaloscypha hepaticicola]